MQSLLTRLYYRNTPNAKGDSFSPFDIVLPLSPSIAMTLKTSEAGFSLTAKESLDARQSTSSPWSTSCTSMQSVNSSSRSASSCNSP